MKRIILIVGCLGIIGVASAQTSKTTKQIQTQKSEDKAAKALPEDVVKNTTETPTKHKKLIYIKNSDLKPLKQTENVKRMPAKQRKRTKLDSKTE